MHTEDSPASVPTVTVDFEAFTSEQGGSGGESVAGRMIGFYGICSVILLVLIW